ncbi:hypothetical protein [Paenibacillus alvei]|nr:hypothetical protein [Paenibacillus alvei]MCY9588349.1 hypothetical protein [Paenibacillus alvei]
MGQYERKKWNGVMEYALVSKGTDFNLSDFKNNAYQPFGYSKDMDYTIKKARYFVKDNPNVEVTFVGHSKGGQKQQQ